MTKPKSPEASFRSRLLSALKAQRRVTSGDPNYHSGRKKKEYASLYQEFFDKLEKAAKKMPQVYTFDIGQVGGISYTDLMEGERILKDIIYECEQSLAGIAHAKSDLEKYGWGKGTGPK